MVYITLSRPRQQKIDEAIRDSLRRGLSYTHAGGSRAAPPLPPEIQAERSWVLDHNRCRLGTGEEDYKRAKKLLKEWGHFQLGWAQVASDTPVRVGGGACVVAQVLVPFTLNPLEIVYVEDGPPKSKARLGSSRPVKDRFAFAHGTLRGHMLAGEERFAVEWNADDDSVWYDVLAFSRPGSALAQVSYPAVRFLQRRFARDSMRCFQNAMASTKENQ